MNTKETHSGFSTLGIIFIAYGLFVLCYSWIEINFYDFLELYLEDYLPVLIVSILAVGFGTIFIALRRALNILERMAPPATPISTPQNIDSALAGKPPVTSEPL